jgi:hypothetical protein
MTEDHFENMNITVDIINLIEYILTQLNEENPEAVFLVVCDPSMNKL